MVKKVRRKRTSISACGAGYFEAERRNGGAAAEGTMNLNFRFPPHEDTLDKSSVAGQVTSFTTGLCYGYGTTSFVQ